MPQQPSTRPLPGGCIFIDSENPPNHRGAVYHQLWHWIQLTTRIDTWHIFTAGHPAKGHYCRQQLVAAGAPAAAIHVLEIREPSPNAADHEIIRHFMTTVPHRTRPSPLCIVMTRDRMLQAVFGYLALEKGIPLHVMCGREYPRDAPRQGELLVAADWRTGEIAPVPLPSDLSAQKQRGLALNLVATAFRLPSHGKGLTPEELHCLNDRYARWFKPLSLTGYLREYLPDYPLEQKGLPRRVWNGLQMHLLKQVIQDWFEQHPTAPFLPPNAVAVIHKTCQKNWPGVFPELSPQSLAGLGEKLSFCPRRGIARDRYLLREETPGLPAPFPRNHGLTF